MSREARGADLRRSLIFPMSSEADKEPAEHGTGCGARKVAKINDKNTRDDQEGWNVTQFKTRTRQSCPLLAPRKDALIMGILLMSRNRAGVEVFCLMTHCAVGKGTDHGTAYSTRVAIELRSFSSVSN